MAWQLSEDLAAFLTTAGGFLRSRAAENTIPLCAAETLRARGATAFGPASPLFGWWPEPDGRVTGAFLHTPPYAVALTSVPAEMAVDLARVLHARGRAASGVNADPAPAEAFARAWHQLTGDSVRISLRTRLYSLVTLTPAEPGPPGGARVAGPEDRALLVAWSDAFHQEATEDRADAGAMVDDRLSYGGLTLWETAGQPVSMAGLTRPAAGQVRVGPVYTPPELRGRGYGGAVTCAVSRAALDAGISDVLLFTDLANPTSNALYQRLGYQPRADRAVWSFGQPAA
jgi:RimJ/RimL family protein N-acetyltransferase